MATITEDYVSFEVAKLLKEKGFNEPCECAYSEGGQYLLSCYKGTADRRIKNDEALDFSYSSTAPTLQMAMKWLRGKGIYITIVYGDYPSLNKVFWTPQIDSLEGFDLPDSFYEEYDNYEQAVKAAIKYCLENLI